jgi:hypothetical protein
LDSFNGHATFKLSVGDVSSKICVSHPNHPR